MISGSYKREDWECPWCGRRMKARQRSHMWNEHNKTMKDYLLLRYNLREWPSCKICGAPCTTCGFNILETCGDYTCRNRLVNSRSMESKNNSFLKFTKEDYSNNARRTMEIRKQKGTEPCRFMKEDSYEKRKLTNKKNKTLYKSSNKTGFLYFIKITTEAKLKIGSTRNLEKRLIDFENSGLHLDDIFYVELSDKDSKEFETLLLNKCSKFRTPILESEYKDFNCYRKIGRTEFFDITIWDKLLVYVSETLQLTLVEYLE